MSHPLNQRVKRSRVCGEGDVRSNLRELLTALADLHSLGLSHGALSPACLKRADNGFRLVSASKIASCNDFYPHNSAVNSNDCFSQLNAPRRSVERALWYRPPEALVPRQLEKVWGADPEGTVRFYAAGDIWAAGCFMAEMANGFPLFASAETSLQLLGLYCTHFSYSYSDDSLTIGGAPNAPNCSSPRLQDLVPGLCEHGYDLLSRLLCCDHKARISAQEALKHPFFSCSRSVPELPSSSSVCCHCPDVFSLGLCDYIYDSSETLYPAHPLSLHGEESGERDRDAVPPPSVGYPSFICGLHSMPQRIQDDFKKKLRRMRRRIGGMKDIPHPFEDVAPAV